VKPQKEPEVICKFCEEPFNPGPTHSGLINVCLQQECQREMWRSGIHEPPPITANVSWEGKHTPIIELVYCPQLSASFNAAQRRNGVSVGTCFTKSSVAPAKRIAGKDYKDSDGKEPGFMWRSGLGEAHHLKR